MGVNVREKNSLVAFRGASPGFGCRARDHRRVVCLACLILRAVDSRVREHLEQVLGGRQFRRGMVSEGFVRVWARTLLG